MGSELQKRQFTIAQPFRKLGKERLTAGEFVFALSLDLEWFTPEEAKKVLDMALRSDLLKMNGDDIEPSFDLKDLEESPGFRPDLTLFKSASNDSTVGNIVRETGMKIDEVTQRVKERHDELGGILEEEVINILVAKELGVNTDGQVDRAYSDLVRPAKDKLSD